MTISLTIICTTVFSIIGYHSLIHLIIPQISNIIKFIANKKHKNDVEILDVNKELLENKEVNNNLYESQINFLLNQVEGYQRQILKKTDELNEINIQFDEVRQQLLLIQKELFDEKQKNIE